MNERVHASINHVVVGSKEAAYIFDLSIGGLLMLYTNRDIFIYLTTNSYMR